MNTKDLLSLRLKKYCAKYEYLETELTETTYLFEEYNKEFIKECYNIEPEQKNTVKTNPVSNLEEEPLNVDDIVAEEETELDKTLKQLYRKLSLKTHPDKPSGDREAFEEVKSAYNNKNALKLIIMAIKYNMPMNELDDNVIEMFEKNIKEMDDKIQNYKKTLAWNWASASETQKEHYKKQFNIK